MPPLLRELDASLSTLIPPARVELSGEWLPASRRRYKSPEQLGTGSGPFVDVVDLKWQGTLTGAEPIAGIAFLVTGDSIFWSKSQPAAATMSVSVSMHAYADYQPGRATFAASLGDAVTPGVPVEYDRDVSEACEVNPAPVLTGRVQTIATIRLATFAVLLIPGRFLKVGRHRLWRVRDNIASSVAPVIREVLTRRRSGTLAAPDAPG